MAQKSVLFNLYSDLLTAISTVVAKKNIFLGDRPKISETDALMSKFAVISLPVSIDDYVVGNKKRKLVTSGVFYLFTQAKKDGTLNINATGEFTDSVIDLFPIKGDYCSATNPVVQMTGSDGQGFQVVTVTFDLQSNWEVFTK